MYKHWTWKYSSLTDAGFKDISPAPFDPYVADPSERDTLGSKKRAGSYFNREEDTEAITIVSRLASEWTFKWCWNKVERGFGHVVPGHQFPSDMPPSDVSAAEGLTRVWTWLSGVDTE